jgi:5'-3' exonuclease
MHYPVVLADRAEADDVIATLVESTQEFGKNEPVMIVSSDKDFFQLHRYSNVKQFSPMKRDFVTVDDPSFYKFDHICRGDVSDGVPNIFSGDDTFTEGIRQKPMRAKKIQEWYDAKDPSQLAEAMGHETYRNFCRNKKVIDLDCIPDDIKESITDKYQLQTNKERGNVLPYLIEKRCNMLISSVTDFFPKA